MAQKLQQQLREVGSKLETLPSTKDALVKLLKQAATCLSELEQSPPAPILESIQPLLDSVVKPELLRHQDRDVKLLVATCICEITRITAPEAPYSDDVLKDIFRLTVSTFDGLRDIGGPSFGRRVVILETLAKYRSCVVMLDLECDDLVNEMFRTFLDVASDDHPESVLSSMQTIMVVLVEESEEVHDDLLHIILSVLGRNRTDISKAARRLAMNVIEKCAGKLEAGIKEFLISLMSGDTKPVNNQIDYHEVIYDVYRCASQILTGVAPYITGELLADQLDTRVKAVSLVGDLFALPSSNISEAFQPIFSEFLKRLSDRVVTVRMSVLECVKKCLLSNTSRPEAPEIISALCDRLLDFEEQVRKQVVAVICDVGCHDLNAIPLETVKLVAERLRDKSLLVKKYTMERLAEIYRACSVKCADGSMMPDDFDWIPGKILRCFYDKDFRFDTIEYVMYGLLFPTEFSIKDKVQHWIRVFSGFDNIEVKALEKIMEQKQRLQQEMQRYLSLRPMCQDVDAPEVQKKILFCFRLMSRSFAEPTKAEESFLILDQLKDANIWKILTSFVDPNTSFRQACTSRDDLLRILGEKHRLYDFLSTLSVKTSYLLFNKEHVKELLLEVATQKSPEYTSSCMNIMVILARFSPILFSGTEEQLINYLKDGDEIIKDGVLHVLAKAGGTIREQLSVSTSSIDLILERVCLEGSRKQAKYAVHALAAITKDDGLKSLSVLYKRLVDMLEEKTHLPAVLQSLGCIAQTAMPVFETRESEIEEFIINKILKCDDKEEGHENKTSWTERSELCMLKIFGIKTLVKSYLPVKDANIRPGIDGLLEILRNMLSCGEMSKDIKSSPSDKAHLRLASAKAILRLSKLWDHKIPIDIFHLTLRTSEISFPEAKRVFLNKIHQYIKDRLLDGKYACAFLLNIFGSEPSDLQEDKQNLADIIQMYQQAKARQTPIQSDSNSSTVYPEYILPYLVHALAHHTCPNVDECKEIEAYEILYRQLYMILSMMMHKDEDTKSEASSILLKETTSTIISIFHCIKQLEDVVDAAKSKNSHAICDLGLSIIKRLAPEDYEVQGLTSSASLPPLMYKTPEKKEGEDSVTCEELTWLAEESALTHFESLKLETSDMIVTETAEAEAMKDGETDGNDVPLGKIMKSMRTKGKKSKKDKSTSAGGNAENNVDILKMVREINIDNLGQSVKFESSNGHEHSPSKKSRPDSKIQKGENRKTSDETSVPVPKRRRSSTGQSAFRSLKSSSKSPSKAAEEALFKKKLVGNNFQRNTKPSPKRKKSSLQSRDGDENEAGEASDYESPNATKETDKKPKRRSFGGLEKCKTKVGERGIEDLMGCRIKVWWPMDKKFYQGTVKSYDANKRKHVILYDDGDVEVLRLEKERWELVDSGRKPPKKPSSSKTSLSKEVSPVKAKSSSGLKQNKNEVNPVKRKRTPKKVTKPRKKVASRSTGREIKEDESSDVSDLEPATTAKNDEINSESSEGEHDTAKMDENVKDEGESDEKAEPASKRKKQKDEQKSEDFTKYEEENSNSGEKESPDKGDAEVSSEASDEQAKQKETTISEETRAEKSDSEGGQPEQPKEDNSDSEESQHEEKSDSEAKEEEKSDSGAKEEEKSDSETKEEEKSDSEAKEEEKSDSGAKEEEKSDSETKEEEKSDSEAKEEEKSDSKEETQEENGASDSIKPNPSNVGDTEMPDVNPVLSNDGDSEMSDDEPLSVWKNRVVKKGSKRVR